MPHFVLCGLFFSFFDHNDLFLLASAAQRSAAGSDTCNTAEACFFVDLDRVSCVSPVSCERSVDECEDIIFRVLNTEPEAVRIFNDIRESDEAAVSIDVLVALPVCVSCCAGILGYTVCKICSIEVDACIQCKESCSINYRYFLDLDAVRILGCDLLKSRYEFIITDSFTLRLY